MTKPIANQAILFEASLILLAWGIAHLLQLPLWQEIKLTWLSLLWGIIATLPLLAGLAWSLHTPSPNFARLRHFVQVHLVPLFAGCSLWQMALIAFLAGIGEELFFRGLLQTGLIAIASVWPGLIITSLIFGLLHYLTRLYAILAALLGLYLGLLFILFDNLVVPIIVHALYDFVALIYLIRIRSGAKE